MNKQRRLPCSFFPNCYTLAAAMLLPCLASCCFAADGLAHATALPNGRMITPAGDTVMLAPFPFAMALRPDGKQMVAPSIGWPFSLNIIDTTQTTPSGRVQRIPPGNKNDPDVQVLTGVAYSPDGTLLYDATGDSGAVDVLATAGWRKTARIPLDGLLGGKSYKESFAANLALSPDGSWLYVVDQANWRVVVIDTKSQKLVGMVPTGVNPLAIALSPDGSRLYVTNSGLFEYSLIEKAEPSAKKSDQEEGLHFPPTGYPSRAAREGTTVEGYKIAALGDENSARGSSLWTYDVGHPQTPKLLNKLRLGATITEAAHGVVGGAAPSGLVADDAHAYVSLAHEDAVAVVPAVGDRVEAQIELSPFTDAAMRDRQGRLLRGIEPLGMAIHDGRLFVAEAGINAVAVVDLKTHTVMGHIPAGWYTAAVTVSPDGKQLFVLNNKGKGSGPNAIRGPRQYIGELEYGSLSTLPLEGLAQRLPAYTQAVIANNLSADALQSALPRTPIKHVFLIIRENRTYDEILGDLPHADGDPTLARFGIHGWAPENPALHDLRITPNAHALATQFATSDRYATDSDVSADGHRWAVGMPPTPWFNVAWTSNYGGRRTGNMKSEAPGRRALSGGNDSPMPEDEPEFGSLWEHVADARLNVLNYGEGLELEGTDEHDDALPQGQRLYMNSPLPKPVFTSTDRLFPTFNLGIPDQFRYAEFAKDFPARLAAGFNPALTVIRLPNDHTAKPRPADGYPLKASFVADNDLALGKIVDLISHSAIWKESAIFVIEDDPQDGLDHVDAHRSVILTISPYARRGFVSHTRTSMTGLQKTMYALLGVGPLSLEDGVAAGLGDMFTATPDLTPYTFMSVDERVFDPAKAKVARPKTAKEAKELLDCDDPEEIESHFHHRRVDAD